LKNTLKPKRVSEMERTNTFIVENCPAIWELADNCAKLYNEANFERRQAYTSRSFHGILNTSTLNTLR